MAARFAALSTYALIALVVMALCRAKWNIKYETWHLAHIVLAVVAVAAGLAHMVGWSFYLTAPWKRALWTGLAIFWGACCCTCASSSRCLCSVGRTASRTCARSAATPGRW